MAIWKRLKSAGEWLRWTSEGVTERWVDSTPWHALGNDYRPRGIDGSTVQEPGSKGISWPLRYSMDLTSLMCTEVLLTRVGEGESFTGLRVNPGDVLLGDRGFAHARGTAHAVGGQGHVIVRVNLTSIRSRDGKGQAFPLPEKLRTLGVEEVGDWDVQVAYKKTLIPGRICAVKLSEAAQEKAVKKCKRRNGKEGKVKPET